MRKHWAPLAALFVVTLAVTACRQGQAAQPAAPAEFAEVERRDLEIRAEASGQIEPIRVVEVKSKASGEILRLPVETGDQVSRGDLLAEIDPRDVRNGYEQAQADLAVAKARLETSVAQRSRTEELRKANVVTEQEYESAILDEANSRAQFVKAQTNLQLAEERLKDVTIRAPIAGMIIERAVEVGTIIASASQNVSGGTTLMKMADLGTMQVRSLIDETDLGKIRAGMDVQVAVEAFPDRRFSGQVLKIEPQAVVEQNVTMFPVLVQLDNSEGLLKVGMNADVEIQIARRENVVVVPNSAVVHSRDAVAAAAVVGISEEDVRAAMRPPQAARPPEVAAQPGAEQPAAAPQAARAQATAPPSAAECTALFQKMQSGGMQGLSEAERAKLGGCRTVMGGQRGQGGQRAGGAGRSQNGQQAGVVFVARAEGGIEARGVTIGVNDWEHTEIIRGVEPGERVVIISVARLQQQQQEFLNRVRERTTGSGPIPGGSGGGGRGIR